MKVRTYPSCSRCGDAHHHWAYCKDGVRKVKSAPIFKKGDPLRGGAKTNHERKRSQDAQETTAPTASASTISLATMETVTSSSADVTETTVHTSPALQARDDLRALAASLPEGGQQRRSVELMLARDEARDAHQRAEGDLKERDPSARLPMPIVLRDTSEDKGRALNMEMDRALFAAGSGRRVEREMLPKEAQAVHNTLAGLEERREASAVSARESARRPEHMNGDQPWRCHGCGQRFRSGRMDQVRERARQEPGWHFVCPECGARKVEIIEVVAV